ncbi:hypothetical protein [Okeania sp. KiyG1]|uniref:hypothetical protein n=1 Tax=Okeania sp. KiyG1 TaxID=2720165 RepID=UPI0019213488|nr:hypothetical protein [Okeania sp. KiyG1]GGA14122.1 hypothetical protein CYANOKiyG1_27620 [Okeania sp. KiyG1]
MRALSSNLGIDPAIIDQWGQNESSSWSLSEAKEQIIESIDDDQFQNNIEELTEELTGAFWNTAMNMANLWDQLHLQAIDRSSPQTFIYQPNRAYGDERVYLHGTPEELRNQIISVNANRTLIDNRDIGYVVTTPDDNPVTNNNGIEIEFWFTNQQGKFRTTKEEKAKGIAIHKPRVPNVDKSKIRWENLKILWNNSVFIDGDYTAIACLNNGREIHCRGNTGETVEKLAKELASLSEAEVIGTIDIRTKTNFTIRYPKGNSSPCTYSGCMFVTTAERQSLSPWVKLTKRRIT